MVIVELDPDQMQSPWIAVIVCANTGVTYTHQCGGVACDQKELEGFLVPLGGYKYDVDLGKIDTQELTALFHSGDACDWGAEGRNFPASRREQLNFAVQQIRFWHSHSQEYQRLKIDETRIDDLCEAWVPVTTPDGPGVLVWENCD